MARRTKDERLQDVHSSALLEFNRAQSSQRDEREQCRADRRFVSIPGAMWEGPLQSQFENKPKLEANKIALSLIKIYSDYRNNRITVDFVSKDGTENDDLAETLDGLYRADEQDSNADEAYDNAFDEATSGGYGAWRLRTCYEDEYNDEDDRQRIRIEPIFDADTSVYFDADAKRQDKADAKCCWVLYSQTRDSYLEEWGDDPASWPKNMSVGEFDWATPDLIYIAEYYEVEEVAETIHIFQPITGEEVRYTDDELRARGESFLEDDSDLNPITEAIDALEAEGTIEVRKKRVKRRKIHKYIMSGNSVLEDCGYIAGKNIPIVPNYGKRWFIDNIERCMGQVRLAKDSQRLKNMQMSKLAEVASLSSIEKPIFTPEQVANHQAMWAEDNIKQYPFMLVNPIMGADGQPMPAGPIGYTKPPQIAPAMAALLQLTEQDMAEILGNNQQAEKMVSNISGKAVELIQTRLDMQTFIYMSNMSKAMRRCGEIWLSMAKEIYTEAGRKMKSVGTQGQIGSVELNKPRVDEETGATVYANDVGNAAFDVTVDVGPSFTSRKDATVRALMGMMQTTQDPTDLKILSNMALMNMDGEGLGDVQEYYRQQMVTMGVIKPTEEEAKAMADAQQNAPPDPQAEYLKAAAEKELAQADQAVADTIYKLASAEEKRASTIKTLSDADIGTLNAAIAGELALRGAAQSDFATAANVSAAPPAALPGEQVG